MCGNKNVSCIRRLPINEVDLGACSKTQLAPTACRPEWPILLLSPHVYQWKITESCRRLAGGHTRRKDSHVTDALRLLSSGLLFLATSVYLCLSYHTARDATQLRHHTCSGATQNFEQILRHMVVPNIAKLLSRNRHS
jgi:hypothetical protein